MSEDAERRIALRLDDGVAARLDEPVVPRAQHDVIARALLGQPKCSARDTQRRSPNVRQLDRLARRQVDDGTGFEERQGTLR